MYVCVSTRACIYRKNKVTSFSGFLTSFSGIKPESLPVQPHPPPCAGGKEVKANAYQPCSYRLLLMCVCVCACACVRIYMYIYTHIYVCECVRACVRIYMYTYTHVCVCVCVCIYIERERERERDRPLIPKEYPFQLCTAFKMTLGLLILIIT